MHYLTFVLGVNLPDHDVIFESFIEKLKSSVTLYAVRLFSKNCASKCVFPRKILRKCVA